MIRTIKTDGSDKTAEKAKGKKPAKSKQAKPKNPAKPREMKKKAEGGKAGPAEFVSPKKEGVEFSVVWRAPAELIPYKNNARTHSPEQLEQIAVSVEEWGWTYPILVDEKDGIIAGHGRQGAAILRGWASVPTITARGWSAAQKRAYILADNKLALNAGWDDKLLALELVELGGLGFKLSSLGFDPAEISKLTMPGNDGVGDPDAIPEVQESATSELGDVWILGRHRIICGDSTDAEAVRRVLAGAKPNLMVTDPPYGVAYDPKWRLEAGINKAHQKRAEGVVMNDDRSDWREAWELFPGMVAYVWHGGLHSASVADSLIASGFTIRSQIIWAKNSLVMGRGHYHWQHEPCWYAARGTASWNGDRKQSTLWEIANMHATQGKVDDGKTNHSTQKPVECMKRPIENNSKPGEAVYEPFSGSGTTIIAGELTGRPIYAVELSPLYVDLAVRRWQEFTGIEAVLEGDGRSFAAIVAEREEASA